MTSADKELEEQLLKAGNKLLDPPSSVDELLHLLDRVEIFLSTVKQSPTKAMQNALSPSLKALVSDKLIKHSDVDVKVAVASCITEITRITAPDPPYDDDQMKQVFQFIVSSFENLYDQSSQSYTKRTTIVETVAKVRACVVMLDLKCDALILDMFHHFFKAVREHHHQESDVFSSMEIIMTLVIEESEDISLDLLSPILASVKKDNEEVLPLARKLGERVLQSCATKLKPYLVQAVRTLGISLDDYSKVLATICQETDERVEDESKTTKEPLQESTQVVKEDAREAPPPEQANPVDEKSPKSMMSNDITQAGEDDSLAEKQEDAENSDQSKDDPVESMVFRDIQSIIDNINKSNEETEVQSALENEHLSSEAKTNQCMPHLLAQNDSGVQLEQKVTSLNLTQSDKELEDEDQSVKEGNISKEMSDKELEDEDQSVKEGNISKETNTIKLNIEKGSTSGNARAFPSLPKEFPHCNQTETDNGKDIEANPPINFQDFEDDGGQLPKPSVPIVAATKDELVTKALSDLEASLKMPLKDIATSKTNSLRLLIALNFLSRLSLDVGALPHGLKAIIDSLHQDFPSILYSFTPNVAKINNFPKRMNEAQEKEARLEKEIEDCEAKLSFLEEQKKKYVAKTIEFKKEFESVRKEKSEMMEDQRKAEQEIFQNDYRWSILCSQFQLNNIDDRNLS